jgi:hypothetical protein
MSYKNCTHLLLRTTLCVVVSLFFVGCATTSAETKIADNQNIQINGVGDWVGALNVPGGNLRLWLSVERDSQGDLRATLDSIDQAPGKKMTVEEINVKENILSFFIPKISAKYLGHWDSSTKQWRGTFTQGQPFDLNFSRGKPKAKPIYAELDGQWQGEIMGHPLIVRIASGQTGTTALLDSPDEGVRGLPISSLAFNDRKVSFVITKAKVKFNGMLVESDGKITGRWVQKGQPLRKITFVKMVKKKQIDLSTQ